jgi:probable selenium-dependent hydroxylase accessory protein YqeC
MRGITVTLDEKLGLDPARDRVISIAGAGGKTTLMFALARERAREGRAAAVMTTTHILCPKPSKTLAVVTGGPQEAARAFSQGKLVAAGSPDAERFKMTAPSGETVKYLLDHAQALIIEADGSKLLPIKFPNDTEPVLLPQTNRVVVVAGLSALGRSMEEVCHRAPLACERLDLSPKEPVTPRVIARLVTEGYARYQPIVLLNQADTPERLRAGEEAAALLRGAFDRVCVMSLLQEGYLEC